MAPHANQGGYDRPHRNRETIKAWLLDAGWRVEEASAGPETVWALVAKLDESLIILGQDSRKTDTVVIQAQLGLRELQDAKIAALPVPDRESVLWDLRFALLHSRVSFAAVDLPQKTISIKRTFYMDDGARRAELMDHVESIQLAIAAFFWTLRRRFGESSSDADFTTN